MTKKAILFDLDGTLLDTLPDLAEGVNYVLKNRNLPSLTEQSIRGYIGDGIFMLIARSLPAGTTEDEIRKAVSEFRAFYKDNLSLKTVPYDGVPELIDKLKLEGYKLGVVTNKLDSAAKLLCEKFYPSFDYIIGNREGIKVKPDPESALIALDALGVTASEAFFIGDSDVDVKTAHNARIDCIAVSWGYRSRKFLIDAKAEIIADTANEVYEIIKKAYF